MTNSPDELVEVMARAFKASLAQQDVLYDADETLLELMMYTGAKADLGAALKTALQALQDAGYVVDKPFWPPGET